MKYRAGIKQSDGWWIGWLVDLPGVNAQERTKRKLIESLQIGAQEMLATQVPFEPETSMTLIDVPGLSGILRGRATYRGAPLTQTGDSPPGQDTNVGRAW